MGVPYATPSRRSPMSATALLDDAGIERLSDLLDTRAVPFRGFNLEGLDGFLSALAVGPEPVPPEEWQPVVWGGKPPRWDSAEEAAEVEALLMAHWRMVEQRVRFPGEDLPDHLAPLLWLPEDSDAEDDDELDVGSDWARGFFRGVELREATWEGWLDAHDWIDEIFALLASIASGEIEPEPETEDDDEDEAAEPTPLDYKRRIGIIAALPGMLADLHLHRIDSLTLRTPRRRAITPERNDPCPCGSGKKYKKCHGA